MPLVRIDTPRMDHDRLQALGDAVQEALMETIGFPVEDRFQIMNNHDGSNGTLRHGTYLDIPRDDGIVYVDITLRAGRTDEQKKSLYARLCQLAQERAHVEPHNVFIVLHENTPSDWSFGYGGSISDLADSPRQRVGQTPRTSSTAVCAVAPN